MCYDDLWGLIAASSWDNNDASVICSQLGYQRNGWLYVCINVHVCKWSMHEFHYRSGEFN